MELYTVFITEILNGNSFETRDICEEVIKTFNNAPVSKPGGEEHLIQIRYSDTHEQKMLKQQTAAGRVFRAAEYEVGVAQARAMSAGPDRYISMSPESQSASNEFEIFMQQHASGYVNVVCSEKRSCLTKAVQLPMAPQLAIVSLGLQPSLQASACLAPPCTRP